jgi:hypothetical protein
MLKAVLSLNGIHQPLIYADNVNLLGASINIIKKNNEALLYVSKEAGTEDSRETKCTFMSLHLNAGQNHKNS